MTGAACERMAGGKIDRAGQGGDVGCYHADECHGQHIGRGLIIGLMESMRVLWRAGDPAFFLTGELVDIIHLCKGQLDGESSGKGCQTGDQYGSTSMHQGALR